MYGVMNTFSEYTYFYRSKNITSYNLLLVFKIDKSFSVSLTVSKEFFYGKFKYNGIFRM